MREYPFKPSNQEGSFVMSEDMDLKKEQWIQEVMNQSDRLFKFLTKPEPDILTSDWIGTSTMETVNKFLQHEKTDTRGVVRFWKHGPQVVFHFPGKIRSPVSVDMNLNVTVSLHHDSLVRDKKYGWRTAAKTPVWIKEFFKPFHKRVLEAGEQRDRYIEARDEAYSQILLNSKIKTRYETFRTKFLQDIESIREQLEAIEYSIPAYSEEKIDYFVNRFLSQDYSIKEYLDRPDKEIFNVLAKIFRKFSKIHHNNEERIENLYILPSSLKELGAARARVLGFLPAGVTELESKVEWSALGGAPYWWFAPDEGILHDIREVDWSLVLERRKFKAKFTLEGIVTYSSIPVPRYIMMGGDSDLSLPRDHPTDFNRVIDLLSKGERLVQLEPPNSEDFSLGTIETKKSLKWWLENLSSEEFCSGLLLLDPQNFSEIPRFPNSSVLIYQQDSMEILDACWRIRISKAKEESARTLQEKYTKIMEKNLTFLFESASSEIHSLRSQVQQLVEELSQVSMKLDEASKTVIGIAGGWTPTWIEKEIFVLKEVLKTVDLQELSRDQLIPLWKKWLKERGMIRSERELMCNLRGLERVNVLERYGILKRLGVKDNAGPKPTLFYLARDQIKEV